MLAGIGKIAPLAFVINCDCGKSFFEVVIAVHPLLHMRLLAFFVPYGLVGNHRYYPFAFYQLNFKPVLKYKWKINVTDRV